MIRQMPDKNPAKSTHNKNEKPSQSRMSPKPRKLEILFYQIENQWVKHKKSPLPAQLQSN